MQTWQSLVADLCLGMGDQGWIWRGQSLASWPLATSLDRTLKGMAADPAERGRREQRALSFFRAHAGQHLGVTPPQDDLLGWLVAMQHYGAPTRLLDWTESPFVAIYFAYRDMPPEQKEPAALWLYDVRLGHMTLIQREELQFPKLRDDTHEGPRPEWPAEINDLVRRYIQSKSPTPLAIVPNRPDSRMTAQQTVLTVDGRVDGGIVYPMRGPVGPLLFKAELPAFWRRQALRDLGMMGITDASLFPGAEGIARHTALMVRDGVRHIRNEVEGY